MKEVAPLGAQHPDRLPADSLVRTWWEASTPTPVSSYIGVVKIVERFLEAGYPRDEVLRALHSAPCPTVNALLVSMNGTKRQSAGDASVEQAMAWLRERADASGE